MIRWFRIAVLTSASVAFLVIASSLPVGLRGTVDAGESLDVAPPPGPVHAGAPPAPTTTKQSPPARGKVIMKRGSNITIELSRGHQAVAHGDIAEVSFLAGDEEIPVGTWRVTRIHDNGTVEAEPIDIMGEPNIGMDAKIFASGIELDLEKNNALAWAYFKGEGQPQDDRKAFDLFLKGCNGGHIPNCLTVAWMYEQGRGSARDEVRAAELYRKGCDGGNPEGCFNLGRMYESGKGVAQDWIRAGDMYARGCAGGWNKGCQNAGWMYHKGLGVRQNDEKAAQFFEKGCEADNPVTCNNLGWLYQIGSGVAQDYS